jgi:hypothetical protein
MNANSKGQFRENIRRQKIDRMRALRVVKYIDYPFILQDSPVEVVEGYILSDRETYDIFASYIFKNITNRPIRKLNIRLDCYLNQNIPYEHIEFTYSQDELTFGIISKDNIDMRLRDANKRAVVEKCESFGSCVYIPLPETYFTRLELVLVSVEYAGGLVQEINALVAGNNNRYNELDNYCKTIYSRSNIYVAAEVKHPTKVVPQFGNDAWLCCCGNKNPNDADTCEICGREKEWQKNNVTAEILENTKEQLINDPREVRFHDKTKFKQNKYLESPAETEEKIKQYEKAMKNIAYEEKRNERKALMLIPKIALLIGFIYLLAFFIKLFITYKETELQNNTKPTEQVETAAVVNNDDMRYYF